MYLFNYTIILYVITSFQLKKALFLASFTPYFLLTNAILNHVFFIINVFYKQTIKKETLKFVSFSFLNKLNYIIAISNLLIFYNFIDSFIGNNKWFIIYRFSSQTICYYCIIIILNVCYFFAF